MSTGADGRTAEAHHQLARPSARVGNLERAVTNALDLDLLRQAHEYLKTLDTRRKLTADYFLEDFRASADYQSLL